LMWKLVDSVREDPSVRLESAQVLASFITSSPNFKVWTVTGIPSEDRIFYLTLERVSRYSTVRFKVLVEVTTLKEKVVSKLMVFPSLIPMSAKVLESSSCYPAKKRLCW
jgi:hypothetical protein